jgi:predicted dehydrogenase
VTGKLKVALVGHGHLGKWHAEKAQLIEDVELVAIVEQNEKNHPLICTKYPYIQVVKDLTEIVDSIDAAIVATPTSAHFEVAKRLLDKGVHVFCEKPVTARFEQAVTLYEMNKNSDVKFQVGHSERFHEVWEIIKTSGFTTYLTSPGAVRINRLAPFKGRGTDVDIVQDLMIHDLDLLNFLFGETPVSLTAEGQKIMTSGWDFVSAQLKYSSGRTAHITSCRGHTEEVRNFEIISPYGCLYIDLLNRTLSSSSFSGELMGTVERREYAARDHLFLEQKAFYQSILSNSKEIVTLKDGLVAVQLVELVLEALETGREVSVSS